MVTGATGGVGSVSVDLLAAAGYEVESASTGNRKPPGISKALGAAEVIGRLPRIPDAKPRPFWQRPAGPVQWTASAAPRWPTC